MIVASVRSPASHSACGNPASALPASAALAVAGVDARPTTPSSGLGFAIQRRGRRSAESFHGHAKEPASVV